MRGSSGPGRLAALILLASCWLALPVGAQAVELVIALSRPVSSADPHFHDQPGNNTLARHLFDTLVNSDGRHALAPGLAVSWRPLGDAGWEFRLRRGVKFHDGSDFSADDVIFSINRASRLPRSPAPFTRFVHTITAAERVDSYTVRFRTRGPNPFLPNDLSNVAILSRDAAEGKTSREITAGDGAVGTGPYRLVRWEPGPRVVLAKHPGYWGGEEPWDTVVLQPVIDDEARLLALTSGTAQLVERLSPAVFARLEKEGAFPLFRGTSNRLFLLELDSQRAKSPYVVAAKKNPLRDVRVRRAISLAIDRQALVTEAMLGVAVPAGQLMPQGFFGSLPGLRPDPYNPRRAKRLLARAGWPRGFRLTLHAPLSNHLNGADVPGRVAAMLTRVGIRTEADTMARSVFYPRAARLQFSLILVGWRASSGEASAPLRALLATYDRHGMGAANPGRYSNPKLDALLKKALRTVDDVQREALLREAQQIGLKDYGVIPLLFESNTWAAQPGIGYTPRADGLTLAMAARPDR